MNDLPPLDPSSLYTDAPEQAYAAAASTQERKQLGQFFTPFAIAEFMARWVIGQRASGEILDPAVGLGVFLRAVLKQPSGQAFRLLGYDIDPRVLAGARRLLDQVPQADVRLLQRDYLLHDWEQRYDGILGNPPYHRFQHYANRNKILEEFRNRLGIALSGLTNLHSLFLLKSVYQLRPGGRAAYIVPSEFLNADYGTYIKEHLLRSGSLRTVIVFEFRETVFDNALTTSCILLLANDDQCRAVEFVTVRSVADLAALAHVDEPSLAESSRASCQLAPESADGKLPTCPTEPGPAQHRSIAYAALDPHRKWRAYYQNHNDGQYRNLAPLSRYAQVVRGIATGANEYFTFPSRKQRDFGITGSFLRPCLTKAGQAPASFFTPADFAELDRRGKNVWLLDAGDGRDEAVARYLRLGEAQGVDQRYLTRHRTPWYALENRPPAPILVTVFARHGLRFVRNEADVRNLTCFHCVYIHDFARPKLDLLMAYLLTGLAREIFTANRREYGDGLEKFEPNDLNRSHVIDLDSIPPETEAGLLDLYHAYRLSVLRREPDGLALAALNEEFERLVRMTR